MSPGLAKVHLEILAQVPVHIMYVLPMVNNLEGGHLLSGQT